MKNRSVAARGWGKEGKEGYGYKRRGTRDLCDVTVLHHDCGSCHINLHMIKFDKYTHKYKSVHVKLAKSK